MIKRIIPVALAGAVMGLTACHSNGGFQKTTNGLEYKIVKDAPGDKKPAIGDIVEMHIITRVGDSTLFNSRKMNNGQPVAFPLPAAAFKGDMPEGIMLLTAGDSAVFHVSLDSMKKMGAQMLPFMKDKKFVEYDVVLVSIKTQQQAMQEQQSKSAVQMQADDKILQDYFTKNNLKPEKSASGLYYTISNPGSGDAPKNGQTMTVNYTGKTIEGKTFDSNTDPQFKHVEPMTFKLGEGSMIPGFSEGVMLLKKGGKGTFYIPSPLAYGPSSPNPNIPANGILVFDIEVTDLK
ncbi:FKBP-type peptidyl-prolyl cis-trans isomerase [Chitinophagaceae bacterium MMS25-I14]